MNTTSEQLVSIPDINVHNLLCFMRDGDINTGHAGMHVYHPECMYFLS